MIPARDFTSASEILAARAALRKRLFSPQARPVKSEETKEQPVTRIYMTAPTERVWRVQHDSHVFAWREWTGNPPLGFLKLRCRQLGLDYERMIGMTRKPGEVEARTGLMAEVKRRFPDISSPVTGKLFGGREHTTILHFWHKAGIREAPKPRASLGYEDIVKEMFFKGALFKDIAAAINRSEPTVSLLVKKKGWTRDRLRLEDHAETLREMFEAGKSSREMAPLVGYSHVHISNFIRKQGWSR